MHFERTLVWQNCFKCSCTSNVSNGLKQINYCNRIIMFYVDDGDDNAEDYNNTLNIDVDVL